MSWDKWAIDASSAGAPFCFCPIDDEGVVVGFAFLGSEPPHGGKVVAVIHADGQEAVDKYYEENKEEIDKLIARCGVKLN
jgi:hypothetical protein